MNRVDHNLHDACRNQIFTARHIQHHAAQLGLRLQLRSGVEMRWKSSGFALL